MRGTIIGRRISNPDACIPIPRHSPFLSFTSSPFSTSSGRGRGIGGAGSPSSEPRQFDFVAQKPDSDDSKPKSSESQSGGIGHGRGKTILPSFSSFVSSAQSGVGRGRVTNQSGPSQLRPEPVPVPVPVPHTFQFTRSRESNPPSDGPCTESVPPTIPMSRSQEPNLPSGIQSSVGGAGRGKPIKPEGPNRRVKEENRHIRVEQSKRDPMPNSTEAAKAQAKVSTEEAVKKAISILSRGGSEAEGSGVRGRMGPGRGRGRGQGRGRGRGWQRDGGRGRGWTEDLDEGYGEGLYLGDNADGEKLAEKVGIENMNKLVEGFEEMSGRVLPSPMEDAYLDALHTNYMIEFEPEYLMGEFDQNPDIDEKPPMPLRDVLEKVKPFIMAYEGIQSQEEWEEAVEETMKNVPLFKEIINYYSGPDRVTAKKQQEELERVAKTIPANAPASVKQFTDRTVLSLQSNPGWGFDKKCQFMDKLVREVSQHYK